MTKRPPPLPDDWRRQDQETYLFGAELRFRRWAPYRPGWDHDHCEFCGAAISNVDGDLHEAYATEDLYRWICEPCFEDFKEEFAWIVAS